jgi:hypothetical protein
LVALAQDRGIGVTGASVTRNRQIGVAFQGAINRSLGIPINSSAFPTSVRNGTVIPDGLVTAQLISLLGEFSVDPEGAFLEVIGHDFLDFLEVKARSSRITPSTARRQIPGFLDVLSQRRLRVASLSLAGAPRPALLLVTTSDTEVSEGVIWEAARCGVALYQAAAEESGGSIRVGSFLQKTSFADVPSRFQFPSVPMPLELR